jgi:hypothetical protein
MVRSFSHKKQLPSATRQIVTPCFNELMASNSAAKTALKQLKDLTDDQLDDLDGLHIIEALATPDLEELWVIVSKELSKESGQAAVVEHKIVFGVMMIPIEDTNLYFLSKLGMDIQDELSDRAETEASQQPRLKLVDPSGNMLAKESVN